MLTNLIEIFCLIALTIGANGQNNSYLQEKPDFIRTCNSSDPNLNECFRENIQALIYNYRYGVPGLPSVGHLEPARVANLALEKSNWRIEANNVILRGLGALRVQDSRVNPKDFSFKLIIFIPEVNIKANYIGHGRLLFIPLSSSGKSFVQPRNISLRLDVRSKLRNVSNITFADLRSIRASLNNVGSFCLESDSWLTGSINIHWRRILEEARSSIENIIEKILLERFRPLFNYIPAEYLIAN